MSHGQPMTEFIRKVMRNVRRQMTAEEWTAFKSEIIDGVETR